VKQTLFATAYLTDDYDAAIAWFRAALGWVLLEDTDMGGGKRWVGYFLHTDDLAAQHARMRAAGVQFEEAPRHEPYGTVAVFRDLHGNRWDLIEPG